MREKSYSNNSKNKLRDFRGGEIKVMNKKFIAIITALALVVTLLAPVGVQEASAASDNSVDRVVTVTDDAYVGGANGPNLIIENDDLANWPVGETFRLQLPDTADWEYSTGDEVQVFSGNTQEGTETATITVITDQIIQVVTNDEVDPGHYIKVPMGVTLDGAEGEVKVTVNPLDSRISGGSYTFAVSQSGNTIVTVGSKKTVSRGTNQAGASIIIDESVKGALTVGETQSFRLRLPNDFEWNASMTNANVQFPANTTGSSVTVGNNKRNLDIEFTVNAANNVRQSIVIEPKIDVTRDASFGDVAVSITNTSGDVSAASGIVIAAYKDYGVSVEIEEVEEFLAGYEDDDEYKTAKITIKETISNSLVNGRVIDFELPSWARVTSGAAFTIDNKTTGGSDITPTLYSDGSKFEVTVGTELDGTGKKEIEMEIPLSISADKTGEIALQISGAGIETQELVIAEAIAPVTAEVNVSDVRLGVQGQVAPEIIITENQAGAIRENKMLVLRFANSIGFTFDSADFEVIEGDLEINQDDSGRESGNQGLEIAIDSESSEASTIKISNIKMTVDRTAPEGPISLDIRGGAIVDNSSYDNFSSRVARFDFANVVTPAPGETRSSSVFTIDSANYTVIESGVEVEKTMDVAPYIKDSRTFLPVFFVAQSLGVSENNIIWEPHTKTVTVIKGDRVAQMQIGNKALTVNGTTIQMDTAPEIKDGRTMLPIFFIGQALGAQVEWDGDTREVTVKQ